MNLRDRMEATEDEAALLGTDANMAFPPDLSVEDAESIAAAAASPKGSDPLPGAVQIVALAILVEDLRARVAELEAKP